MPPNGNIPIANKIVENVSHEKDNKMNQMPLPHGSVLDPTPGKHKPFFLHVHIK